jgi:glycosyltransferase involved in cell wall biosynthesis
MLINIDRKEFKPIIITLSKEPKNSIYEDFIMLKIDIYSLGLSRLGFRLKGKRKLIKIIEELEPDIIHTSGYRADIFAVKYLNKFKHCNTIHNFAIEDYYMTYGRIIGKIMAKNHIKALSKMTYPIACSYSITKKLKEQCNIHSYSIPNGVDEIYFSPVDKLEKARRREKLGLNTRKRIFIFIGTMSNLKDPFTTIKSFKKANISSSAMLVLLGDGPLLKKCKKYNDESIVVKGKVNNVREFLKCADVFVSSSKSEGLPMAVLEAINCGLPTILSNIESHREILNKNPIIGDKFNIGNIDELKRYFKYYTKCNLEYKSKAARKLGETFYNSKVMCDAYEKMYTQILE